MRESHIKPNKICPYLHICSYVSHKNSQFEADGIKLYRLYQQIFILRIIHNDTQYDANYEIEVISWNFLIN